MFTEEDSIVSTTQSNMILQELKDEEAIQKAMQDEIEKYN